MKDQQFKELLHEARQYVKLKPGSQVEKGYKPDIAFVKDKDYILMECDTNTTRKGYVGAMIKAAKFLTGERAGVLICVIKERENTTVSQIQRHLTPYYRWIQHMTNMKAIYVISTYSYCPEDKPVRILSRQFSKNALAILKKQ